MPAHFTEIKIMLEQHGTYTIARETSKGHEDQYNVMNDVTGHVRWFPTIQECRQFIGVEPKTGPLWEVTPLDDHGKPMHDAAVVSATDEASAKEAGRSWFHFIGVFRIKDIQVTPHKPGG